MNSHFYDSKTRNRVPNFTRARGLDTTVIPHAEPQTSVQLHSRLILPQTNKLRIRTTPKPIRYLKVSRHNKHVTWMNPQHVIPTMTFPSTAHLTNTVIASITPRAFDRPPVRNAPRQCHPSPTVTDRHRPSPTGACRHRKQSRRLNPGPNKERQSGSLPHDGCIESAE